MNISEWQKTKKYMLPYDGGASQIHLLSIPKGNIQRILSIISSSVNKPVISLISNEPLSENISLIEEIMDKVFLEKFNYGQSTISASIFDIANITFELWAEDTKVTFDLEVWFWADQFFTENDSLNLNRFNELLKILKSIVNELECKCILTPCEASDPLEDLQKGYGVEIKLKSA